MSRLLPSLVRGRSWSPPRRHAAWVALWLQKRRRQRGGVETAPDVHLLNGLAGYWKLGEPTGDGRMDSHTGGYHLTDVNEVTQVVGRIGGAADFHYIEFDRWLDHADTPDLRFTGDWTISCWLFRTGEIFGGESVFAKDGAIALVLEGALGFAPRIWMESEVIDGTEGVPLEIWTHFVAYREGTTFGFVINNGVPWEQTNASAIGDGTLFRMGATSAGYPFAGLMDEFGKWNRALSPAEIAALYNAGAGITYENFTP